MPSRSDGQGPTLCPQVCGSPDIPLHLLKSVATYKGVEPSAPLAQWFWEVMEAFSNTERSLFLRFVWGRTRLPRTIADFRGRDFVIQVGSGLGSQAGGTVSCLPPAFPFLLGAGVGLRNAAGAGWPPVGSVWAPAHSARRPAGLEHPRSLVLRLEENTGLVI